VYNGYLRVNQRGREPSGIVAPGAEREALLTQIETAVHALRIAGTNELAARNVVRPQEAYPGRAAAQLPDLMILWKNDRLLDAVESPTVGRIENRDRGRRPAHSARGRIFAYGPGIAQGAPTVEARDIDIGPTVLALLGVASPPEIDGRPIAELLCQTR
jgi:predicted AlkP superfamily phosphohydrolase/phosphomutase